MNRRIFYPLICVFALCMGISSCSQGDEPQGPEEVTEDRSIDLTDAQAAVLANVRDFEYEFIESALNSPNPEMRDKNILLAPWNAAENLALNSFISRTQLEDVVKDVFDVENLDVLGDLFQKLNYAVPYRDVANVKISKANSCWFENDWISSSEQKDINNYFGCEFKQMDIHSASAVELINSWASECTDGLIPHVISEVSPQASCVSASAQLFTGSWRHKFDPANTHSGTFHGIEGDTPVQMMSQKCNFNHLLAPEWEAFLISFGESKYCLRILLPCGDKSVYDLSKDGLMQDVFSEYLLYCEGQVEIPKMELSSPQNGYLLTNIYSSMESFNKWHGHEGLKNLDQTQNTRAIFNEEGAKVAAVTIDIGYTSVFPQERDFICDRPFVFAIIETQSQMPLFAGRVVKL